MDPVATMDTHNASQVKYSSRCIYPMPPSPAAVRRPPIGPNNFPSIFRVYTSRGWVGLESAVFDLFPGSGAICASVRAEPRPVCDRSEKPAWRATAQTVKTARKRIHWALVWSVFRQRYRVPTGYRLSTRANEQTIVAVNPWSTLVLLVPRRFTYNTSPSGQLSPTHARAMFGKLKMGSALRAKAMAAIQ
eukprot:3503739-Pyramimonas_sp.AAC.1